MSSATSNENGVVSNDNTRPPFDAIVQQIADYVFDYEVTSDRAWARAHVALLDSLGCAIESTPVCASFIGPVAKGTVVPNGFALPASRHVVDPLKGAFDLGALIRYLDHSDAFPGAEWGHPSDNIGAILPVAYYLSKSGERDLRMKDVFEAIIKAYEIQGIFQMKNAFNKVGIDHVVLVKIAATAVVSKLMGLTRAQTMDAISQAFADGQPLRVYRQGSNTSPRKGWAAGDACMRAVHMANMTKSGQPGYPTVLTAPKWGFYDTSFQSKPFVLPVPFGTMVIEHFFIKLVVAEGHGIAAVEAALTLSETLRGRIDEIQHIRIRTQEAAMVIIDKTGPLHNAADRDHCMRYMVAVTLLKGKWLEAKDYDDSAPWAADPRVEALRRKISMEEDPQMTRDYHDMTKKKAASALLVTLADGTTLDEVLVERPVGHPGRADTEEKTREKFVELAGAALADPAAVWARTMRRDTEQLRVSEWYDSFLAAHKDQ